MADRPLKVSIAHGNIVSRDAIGVDIIGMYDILAESGFDTNLICERHDEAVAAHAPILLVDEAMAALHPDILIYHHSILWQQGEALLKALKSVPVMKYHNVTPAEFFEGYSIDYFNLCHAGREQTRRLTALIGATGYCTADSDYNAAELVAVGAEEVSVAPPFTHMADFLRPPRAASSPDLVSVLFVGRVAPHKGHFSLLTVIAAYVAAYGPGIRLTMVGGRDDLLEEYSESVRRQIAALGIAEQVRILDSIDDATLVRLFAEADIFLCMSEHEGFCVPIIEAQAAGIPVVSVDTTALGETIGPGQFTVPAPRVKADYLHIAELIHAACTNPALRAQLVAAGQRNVLRRFDPVTTADRFIDSLAPVLERLA